MDVAERRIAAVVGALAADAADGLLKDVDDVGFREPSENPFYRLPLGSQSCYGDQAFAILKSLVECQGVNIKHLQKETYEVFGPTSPYENEVNTVYHRKTDVTSKEFPIDGHWRHFSIKHFLRSFEEGQENTGSPTDKQIDCMLRIVPVVALYAGTSQMIARAEEVIRVTQDTDEAVAMGLAAARLLEIYILNGSTPDAVERVVQQLSAPARNNPQDLDNAVVSFLREFGLESIPITWSSKTRLYLEALELAKKLTSI